MNLSRLVRMLCGLLAASSLLVASPAGAVSEREWLDDVHRAMDGSVHYLAERVRSGHHRRLALNLDIDNTSLATHYSPGEPVRDVRRLARYAGRHDVAVLFNTGRLKSKVGEARRLLRNAGFPITEMCWRKREGQRLVTSKQRCRRHFVREGYTIVANVGNRRSDFVGGHYQRAFRLPSYGNTLS